MENDVRNAAGRPALWLLPLVAGLLPFVAAVAALVLAIQAGQFPACVPLIDGCVSVSRAGRYDLPNHVFRALVLPAAVLQALTWLACHAWLRKRGIARAPGLRALPWLGIIAGVFLILYGTFLGTEGDAYRWMRRYGVIVYFGFTYLAMLITGSALWYAKHSRLGPPILALCALILVIGLAQVFVPPFIGDEGFKNRFENVLEWHTGLAFTVFFILLAVIWRTTRLSLHIQGPDGPPPP